MKTYTLITVAALLMLTSCVSSKKYNEKVSAWEKKYIELSADYDRLQTDLEELNEVTTETMLYNEQVLQEKDLALKEEAKKLQELKSLLDEQRNAIIALKQEVCSAL